MAADLHHILFVDSYDSFAYNLASLCKQAIPNCVVHLIQNDSFVISQLLPYLPYFSAVVIGPGPGTPEKDQDIGVIKDLWTLPEKSLVPIFGVCLGLQSLGVAHGARLKRLDVVKHGQISSIQHTGCDLFHGVGPVDAVRYHSLHVVPSKDCDELGVLAWANDGMENGRVVMALRHTCKPFWAVQYHPESVCTRGGGVEVLQNFWRLAQSWRSKTGSWVLPWGSAVEETIGKPWQSFPPPYISCSVPAASRPTVTTQILEIPEVTAAIVCDLFGVSDESSPFVLLDSAAQPGRFSIVGSLMQTSPQITHFVGDDFVSLIRGRHVIKEKLNDRDVWTWLADFMANKRVSGGHPEVPFWGGLVGVLSYELGVHSLNVSLDKFQGEERQHPDANLVFVERSVVLDSANGRVFVQSLIPDDSWVADTAYLLSKKLAQKVQAAPPIVDAAAVVRLPDKSVYISRIHEAKERIFAGDSYELCLTARTTIAVPQVPSATGSSSWRRYQTLRSKNPAPYSAYIRLHPTTLLSSSPERFLSTSRPPNPIFHLRPIKGTVRKGPGITRAVAEAALAGSVKEVAENLMIVDLIRHDLHAVVGEDVQVKQFCTVEEYETVWQLVSVIEGKLEQGSCAAEDPDTQLGWEMLRHALPPGSMTGAPKKRSVEILQTLEDHRRSVYSGVFGYWCVGGGTDWSVTIRSCFKLDEQPDPVVEEWHLGAGGAITALSDAEAEWEEMVTKLKSVVGAFGVSL